MPASKMKRSAPKKTAKTVKNSAPKKIKLMKAAADRGEDITIEIV